MIKKRVNKINWHGSDLENNRAKAPNISTPGGNGLDGLNDGEIYVCNADEDPAIFIKTNKDKVARVGGNGSDSYSRDQIDDFLGKKLDKVVWDRNLEERVDDNGKEYLFLTKPLITAYGVTMYAGADVQVPSIYEGLPIDGVTIQWVDGKLVATGGAGTANGIVVNGNTYTPNEDGIITLPNYPSLSGYATEQWVNNTLSGYATSSSLSQLSAKVDNFLEGTDTDGIINKWKELESFLAGQTQTSTLAELLSVKADKATTIAGYGITDAYTKNDISGLLADYVTKSGAQDITGIKSFINGLNIGDILVKKHSDGVVELDGDLILTGSLTMFAQGSHTASTILDALPIDNTTLSKEGGVLSVIGGVGGGSVDGIILNGTTYSPDEATKLITLPNYPTTLPASDVYPWAKAANKPSYTFDELLSKPTTVAGYGITDAVTLSGEQTITGIKRFESDLYFGANKGIASATGVLELGRYTGTIYLQGTTLSNSLYYSDKAGSNFAILHAGNYNSYAPTLTGGGASGNWDINVTGYSNGLSIAGYGSNSLTYFQTNEAFAGLSATWRHYIICNHGNGETYFNRIIALDFFNDRISTSRMQNGTREPWKALMFVEEDAAVTVNNVIKAYRYKISNSLPAITFDKPGSYAAGIGADGTGSRIRFGAVQDMDGDAWVNWNGNTWYFDGMIQSTGNILAAGGMTMYGSDETKKDILGSFIIPLDYISNAPLWRYTWKDKRNERVNIGGSAQYTKLMMEELVGESEKGLVMDYATTAYAFSVSLAKHLSDLILNMGSQEGRLARLEREDEGLKERVMELERRAA